MRLLHGQDIHDDDGEWIRYEPGAWESVRVWWARLWWPLFRHRHNRRVVDGIMAKLEPKLAEGYRYAEPIWQTKDYGTWFGVGVRASRDTEKWRFAVAMSRRSTEQDFLAVRIDLCGRLGYSLYPCKPPREKPGMLIDLATTYVNTTPDA